jgi:GNAT superfamily N-acetyltransferase
MKRENHTTATSGEQIAIRKALPDDVVRIVELLIESAESQGAPEALCVDAAALLREGFGEPRRFRALVAESAGDIVGVAVYCFTFSTWTSINGMYLEDLYVEAAWRRRGIARALVLALANIAVEQDCRRFQWLVLRSNQAAIAFYESLGATATDEWMLMQMDGTTLDRLTRASLD